VRATLLESVDQPAIKALLSADEENHIFLHGMIQRRGIGSDPRERWWGAWGPERQLRTVAFFGEHDTSAGQGLVVCAGDPLGAEAIGAKLSRVPAMCIGPLPAVDALWAGMGGPAHRLATRSRSYSCKSVTPGPTLDIRPASMNDLEWLSLAAREMMMEDLGIDPQAEDPQAHDHRTRTSIAAGRSWVGTVDGQYAFRLRVGSCCAHGVQVGGTWVPPALRGQGIGAGGMRAVCARLLRTESLVTLHVREDNHPAVQCYTHVGFKPGAPLRLIAR